MGGLDARREDLPGITVLRSAAAAIRSLGKASAYAAWLRVPHEDPPPTDEDVAAEARRVAEELVVEAGEDGGWLDVEQITDLLDRYGLVPIGTLVHSPLAASAAAARTGFPVAVKVADQHVVHKTDRGLVRVGLQSGMEVLSSVRAFEEELGHDEVPVLVQPVVSGVEVALGVVRDPGFGPMVMVAAGGVATDLWNDRAFLVPPVSRADATRALRSLRIWPLLEGYRGSHRGDVDALAGLVVSLGALATDVPQVAELDLNPVVVTPEGCVLVDIKVRVASGLPVNAGIPRQLRSPR
jgi:hypothetical protein